MLLTSLEDLYDKHDHMLVCNRGILATPLEEPKGHSNCQLENIIKYAKPIVKQNIQQAQQNGPNFKPIYKHFLPISDIVPPDSTTVQPQSTTI